jgi:hypothetical protein
MHKTQFAIEIMGRPPSSPKTTPAIRLANKKARVFIGSPFCLNEWQINGAPYRYTAESIEVKQK